MKEFYGKIKGTALFSHIVKDEDLAWLLQCIEGRIVPADKKDDLWEEDGFLFVKIGQNKALRIKKIRVEKLCGFKCDFHIKLIEKLTGYWKNN